MKYIVFPVEKLQEIPQEVLNELHLSPRKSIDGSNVIMKVCNYELLFPSIILLSELGEETEVTYPYPVYEGNSLEELLSGPEWTNVESSNTNSNETDK